MSRIIIAVLSLVLSVALAFISVTYIKSTCNTMITEVDNILDNVYAQNTEEVNRLAVLANTHWESKKFLMNVFIGQSQALEITAELEKILQFARHGDLTSVTLYSEECKSKLSNIIQSNEPSLSTVL